jgi:hypothetical protein
MPAKILGEKLLEPDIYGWVFNYGTGDWAETPECSDVIWNKINASNGS